MADNSYKWQWMQELDKRIMNAFEDAFNESDPEYPPKSVHTDVIFDDDSCIEICINRNNDVEVNFYHSNSSERLCPNIEQYIQDNLPSWDDYYEAYCENNQPWDEWTEHGFRNEADYWKYRLG